MENDSCKSCQWWQDYKDRVYAVLSFAGNGPVAGSWELRACKYRPAPCVDQTFHKYTDENYLCSAYQKSEAK